MARCPNCDAKLAWDAAQCAACAAAFAEPGAWRPIPEGWEEARQIEQKNARAAGATGVSRPKKLRLTSRESLTRIGVGIAAWMIFAVAFLGARVLLWSLVAVGSALCAGAAFFAAQAWLFYRRGARTRGTVIDVFSMSGRTTGRYPLVEFPLDDGRTVRFEDTAAKHPRWKAGQSVEVLYDPADTADAFALYPGRLVLPYASYFACGAIMLFVSYFIAGFVRAA